MTDIFTTCQRENRIVHGWLLHTQERRQKHLDQREEIEHGGKACMNCEESVHASSDSGGVTASKAMQLTKEEMLQDEKMARLHRRA